MSGKIANALKQTKPLSGIFPLLKEKGDSVEDNRLWTKWTLKYEARIEMSQRLRAFVSVMPNTLETFASGLLCVFVGGREEALSCVSNYWPHQWQVSAKLGANTQTCHSDSPVVSVMPFDDVSEESMREKFSLFIGKTEQRLPPRMAYEPLINRYDESEKSTKTPQTIEYVPIANFMPKKCHSIELMDFNKPYFTLRVVSCGHFSCRALIRDLAQALNTGAHVTDLTLERMGPIGREDALRKYELHLKNICDAFDKYTSICKSSLNSLNINPKKPYRIL